MTAWTLTGVCVVCGAKFWTYCDPPHRMTCSDRCYENVLAMNMDEYHEWRRQRERDRP